MIGRIPEALTGRFLRIGPNPIDEPHPLWLVGHHWFAGTGMAHGLRLRDGKAEWFRSRFVLDEHAAKVRSSKPIPGPGEGQRDGNVNTNLMNVGGKLCAVVEAGSIPVELDYELESVRRTDFDGTLEAGFTGHPHFDPVTGEHHALAYEPFQPVRYISVDRDGRATTKARIDLPHIPLIHDMAFTQSFIVVPDFPVTFQPEHAHTDFPWLWDERRPSRIGLLPRNGDVSASSGSRRRAASPFTSPTPTTTAISPSSTCRSTRACSSPIRTAPTKARRSWCGGRSIARPGA